MLIKKWYEAYLHSQPFTDDEAWSLFRFAAFGEAVGWTLLIIGIVCEKLPVSWSQYPVHFFGTIHGLLFFAYIGAVLSCGPSLDWRGPKIILAGLCSVPPYGSLLFELFASCIRNRNSFTRAVIRVRYDNILRNV